MPIQTTFENFLSKVVTSFNSFMYSDIDLLSPGLWKVLAKYVAIFRFVLPFGILLKERKIYLAKCSVLKRTIIILSTTQLLAYPVITFLLLIQKLYFTRQEASDDMHGWIRTLAMFYIIFLFPAIIPTSVMISFRGGPICQMVNPIVDFRGRIRGNNLMG